MYAAVLIRSIMGTRPDVRDTLTMLRLRKKHAAVVIDEKKMPNAIGMLEICKDFVTFGPVSEGVAKKMQERAKDGVVHLAPPRGGFERKGIKKSFNEGGALGRRESMDKLLEKML